MRGRLLSTTLFLIASGVLVQALTAGFFISGTANTRMLHIIVAAILPYLAIVPTVSAWRRRGRGVMTTNLAVWTTLLMVGLWVQEALGHMPFPVTTVIHVPLGVILFALPLLLATSAYRAGA
jgi:heme A synthase